LQFSGLRRSDAGDCTFDHEFGHGSLLVKKVDGASKVCNGRVS
jgi:hypothetical protein